MTPEQRKKHVKTIETIELSKRPEKWRLIKKFLLELHPEFIPLEHDHSQACKELREVSNKYASSQTGVMRNSMKIFGPVYTAIIRLDPELKTELDARNNASAPLIGKQLWEAFPEYRIARSY